MFKVKNKSVKVITIGKVDLLPDKSTELPDELKENPVIKLFLKNGFLSEIPDMKDDEESETPEKIAAKVKKMNKPDVITKLKELNIEFDEKANADVLKQLLVDALV